MTIEGRPVVRTPPTDEQVAEQRAAIDAIRREREEAIAQSAPVDRRLLEAGPPLRDVDAALACLDSCHPRIDVTDRHAGGRPATASRRPSSGRRAAGACSKTGRRSTTVATPRRRRGRRTAVTAQRASSSGPSRPAASWTTPGPVDRRDSGRQR